MVIPKYESKVTLLLTHTEEKVDSDYSITQSDLSLNSNLIGTYGKIIKSEAVLKQVKENLKLNMSVQQLYQSIRVGEATNTQILEILVQHEDGYKAKIIANEIAEVFSEKINQYYKINNVKIIDEASESMTPYNVNHTKDILMFGMFGLMLVIALILIIYLTDTTVKEEEDVEELINLPVIISLPASRNKDKDAKDLISFANSKSTTAECFRTLRTNLIFAQKEEELKNILITSCGPGEGKTYVSANLATTFAKVNKKVIVIDADMRKGRLHNIFKLENSMGLSNYLKDLVEGNKVTIKQTAKYIKETNIPNLHIMTSGDRPLNPLELISSNKMNDIIKTLDKIYDVVIIDGTPSAIVSDSMAISKYINTILIVAEHKKTKIEVLKKVKRQIENVSGKVTGVILNKCPMTEKQYGDGYYSDTNDKTQILLEKNVKIKTVQDFLSEVKEDKEIIQEETGLQVEDCEIQPKTKRKKEDAEVIRDIKKEVTLVKNLFVQYIMANQNVQRKIGDGTSEQKIDELKKEIDSLKRAIKTKEKNEKILGEDLKDEIINLRKTQEELKQIHTSNNEKIDELIESYRKKIKM